MAHPHRDGGRNAVEQRIAGHDFDGHLAVFAFRSGNDLSAELVGHQLHAVADAQNRQAHGENGGIDGRRAIFEHAVRAAGEDDSGRRILLQFLRRRVTADDFRIDFHFTDAPRDQLRILRTVIQNCNPLFVHVFSLFLLSPTAGHRRYHSTAGRRRYHSTAGRRRYNTQ